MGVLRRVQGASEAVASHDTQIAVSDNLEKTLEALTGKAKAVTPHLKLGEKLPKLTLAGLNPTLWPKGSSADDLLQ